MVNGDSRSLIDKDTFYRATFNFKMFIFNVYENLFDNCNSFALPQKNAGSFCGILMVILP